MLASLCASPSLVFLCLLAITEDYLDVLETIAAACTSPRLLHLQVPDVRDLHTATDAGRVLGPFTSLQTARFGRIDREMLQVLGSLPNLRTLTGEFAMADNRMHTPAETKAAFPAPQELTTSCRDDVHVPPTEPAPPLMLFQSLTVLSLRIFTESTEGLLAHLEWAFASSSPALAQLQELTMRIEVNRVPLFGILDP